MDPAEACRLHFDRLEAPPRRRQVRRLRRDRHRQPGEVAASRRTRSSARSPTRSSRRTSRCSRAATRSSRGCCCSAGPTPTCPFLQDCWRQRIPETWESAATTGRRTCPIEELIFVPEGRAVLRRVRRGVYGLARAGRRGPLSRASTALEEYITNGRKARLGEKAGPPLVEEPTTSSTSSASSTRSRSSSHAEVRRRARSCAASSASTAARPRRRPCSSTRTGELLTKAYQLSKGNPIEDTKELLAKIQAFVQRPGRDARGAGLRRHRLRGRRARGVAARRRQHRRDRRAHDGAP